jgi:hypothetical protein
MTPLGGGRLRTESSICSIGYLDSSACFFGYATHFNRCPALAQFTDPEKSRMDPAIRLPTWRGLLIDLFAAAVTSYTYGRLPRTFACLFGCPYFDGCHILVGYAMVLSSLVAIEAAAMSSKSYPNNGPNGPIDDPEQRGSSTFGRGREVTEPSENLRTPRKSREAGSEGYR